MSQGEDLHSRASCIDPRLIARAERVVAALRARRITVVTAESCTAGLVASVLSQADGAGEVLHGAFVAYSKLQKTAALGVSPELLERSGSVNEEVACAMVEGALAGSPARFALSVTGVLGPEPDEDGNAIGLVHLCCKERGQKARLARCELGRQPHDRLRHHTVCAALDLLAECVKKA